MTNIIGVLDLLRDRTVKHLLLHDVTILAIFIKRNDKNDHARYIIQCKMDEQYMTWAEEYFSHREEFTEEFDKMYVPFIDGEVFALIDREDM